MCRSLGDIKWYDPTHAMTAFLTVILMPLTYSIAYGLIAGICCYALMTGTFRLLEFVGIQRPVFEPPIEEDVLEALVKKDEAEEGDESEEHFVEADFDDTKPHGEEGSDEAQSPGNSLSPASGTNLDLLFHNIFCLFDSTVAPFCEAATVPNYDCKFISVCVLKVYWFAFNVVQELQHTQEAGTFWANKPSRKAWSSS